jgi:hypothetical protein
VSRPTHFREWPMRDVIADSLSEIWDRDGASPVFFIHEDRRFPNRRCGQAGRLKSAPPFRVAKKVRYAHRDGVPDLLIGAEEGSIR